MATTKQQAEARLVGDDSAAVRELTREIEAAIAKYDGQRVTVSPRCGSRVREAVAATYRASGWTVEHGDDQRDGAWMTLR